MKSTRTIDIHHLTRVEGHGNIKIRIKDGKLEEARWEVVETPRFFEAMLVGKKWENAPWISGRICGICSIGHTLASIRASKTPSGSFPTDRRENCGCSSSTWKRSRATSCTSISLSPPTF